MLSRFVYVLPSCLYCHPAYPALMELLKSRYEGNLGGPAFVRACIPIRWEHGDKNQSNACRSCHSMHNNLQLCGWKKSTLRWERRVLKRVVLVINMYKVCLDSLLANVNDQYCRALYFKSVRQIKVLFYCLELFAEAFLCVCILFSGLNIHTIS